MEGIERIKKMSVGQKDIMLLEIVKYLISREDMNDKYLNDEKDLKGMALYIQGEVMKDFCEKMNIQDPSSFAQEVKYNNKSVRCLVLGMSKEKTYELAIKYFNKSNKELGIKLEEKKRAKTKNNEEDNEFGSIFSVENSNKVEDKEKIEQISLFAA